jgi:hypothetical protein
MRLGGVDSQVTLNLRLIVLVPLTHPPHFEPSKMPFRKSFSMEKGSAQTFRKPEREMKINRLKQD